MDSSSAAGDHRERMQRLDALIQEAERLPDPVAREHVREIVSLLLDVHGAGLDRLLDGVAGLGEPGLALIDALAGDELVGALLLLHGLHPRDVETRVREAVQRVGPLVRSHGGEVELLGLVNGRVHLRLRASGCASTAAALRSALEAAIYDAAPEVAGIDVEGATSVALQQLGLLSRTMTPLDSQ
jgi:Fe-S cluster biogenesis protein NfuA